MRRGSTVPSHAALLKREGVSFFHSRAPFVKDDQTIAPPGAIVKSVAGEGFEPATLQREIYIESSRLVRAFIRYNSFVLLLTRKLKVPK